MKNQQLFDIQPLICFAIPPTPPNYTNELQTDMCKDFICIKVNKRCNTFRSEKLVVALFS